MEYKYSSKDEIHQKPSDGSQGQRSSYEKELESSIGTNVTGWSVMRNI